MKDPATSSDDTVDRLRSAWIRHVDDDVSLFDRLVTRHREKHRHYHRLEHVDHVVRDIEALGVAEEVPAEDVSTAVAAAVYHDAIHEPRSPSNERASARLARRDLATLGWPHERIDAIAAMIEGTSTHREPADHATALLYDSDLAILGSEPASYEFYRDAVRREYGHVDDEAWRVGRGEVLRSFLDRPRIYATETAHDRWDEQARRNLASEIESLRT